MVRDLFSKETRNKIIEANNASIINTIINEIDTKRNILLFGEVQSGKTGNIIKIIKGLIDRKKIDYVFYVTGNTTNLKKQNFDRLHEEFQVNNIKMVDASSSFLSTGANNLILEGGVVFTCLKQYFSKLEKYISHNLEGKNILVIDDEADDYSNSENNSKIIKNLVSAGCRLISITATPFRNLCSNEETYDAFYKLTPWDGYHGRNDFKENFFNIDNLSYLQVNIIALLWWGKITFENDLEHSQLLFNTDTSINVHNIDKKSVIEIINEGYSNKLRYKEFFTKVTGEEIDIDSVFELLNSLINENKFKQMNNKEQDILENEGLEIIFGGNLLSRGITYDNLVLEVYRNIKEKTTAHTLIQRARWFGYRNSTKRGRPPMKDKIKILLESKTIQALEEVNSLYEITLNYGLKNEGYKKVVREASKNWERITVE